MLGFNGGFHKINNDSPSKVCKKCLNNSGIEVLTWPAQLKDYSVTVANRKSEHKAEELRK